MQSRLRLRILSQQHPRPGQGIGYRLKPGEKQRQNLIANLLRIQVVPVTSGLIVPRRHQHRKQVGMAVQVCIRLPRHC